MEHNFKNDLIEYIKVLNFFKKQGLNFSNVKYFLNTFPKEYINYVLEKNVTTNMYCDFPILEDGKCFRIYNFRYRGDGISAVFGIIIEKVDADDYCQDNVEYLQIWPYMNELDRYKPVLCYGNDIGKTKMFETYYLKEEDGFVFVKKIITKDNEDNIVFEGKVELDKNLLDKKENNIEF